MLKYKKKKIYQVAGPYFSPKDINWIQKKTKKVLTGRLSTGPYCLEFEKRIAKFVGVKYAVFLNTCTSALEISVKYLNLKKGDEVIVPCETFIATGMAVTSQGGKIVFANINPNTFCLDLKEIRKRVNTLRPLIANKLKVFDVGYLDLTLKIFNFFIIKKEIIKIKF